MTLIKPFTAPLTDVLSSLPLQISLHLNACLAPFWAISLITCLLTKYEYLSVSYRVVLVAIYLIVVFVEPIRLYLGFYGNLGQKVGFLILSLHLMVSSVIVFDKQPTILMNQKEHRILFYTLADRDVWMKILLIINLFIRN
ncbi:hypothetical protein AB6A40_010792 [Gnathostoma spinigerum]|uniref:Uncharacterized protein n=1 Tax=Gnathostoma spinigerum TaxID=75299 RepID=A0ABD6EVX5_9BILA